MTDENDVVAVLTRQHRQLEAQLRSLLEAAESGDADACVAVLARSGDELALHILAEEQLVYPAVHAARTEYFLLESLEEHLSLKRLLADLLALDPEDASFTSKCKLLEEQARRHHEEEEEHLFPRMRRLLDGPALHVMGAAARAHEQALRANGAPRERVAARTEAAATLA